jgi:hypothetical protein
VSYIIGPRQSEDERQKPVEKMDYDILYCHAMGCGVVTSTIGLLVLVDVLSTRLIIGWLLVCVGLIFSHVSHHLSRERKNK